MQGSKKAPTSEVIRNASEASGLPRRDDRAEPEDDPSSSRIEVVNVDPARSDNAASGMISLRRELAKLHQQAAAVEKSLEDQRRDRSDSLERLERANEHALQLEARLRAAEGEATSLRKMHETSVAELLKVREERNDLALAVETAKVSTSELGRVQGEIGQLRARAESASRELTESKQAAASAVAEVKHAKIEVEKARKALDLAEEDAAMVGDQASKIREEAAKLRVEVQDARAAAAKANTELAEVREKTSKSEAEIAKAREQASKSETELAKIREKTSKSDAEIAKARDEASKVNAELTKTRAEAQTANAELTKTRAEAQTANAELATLRVRAETAAADVEKLCEDLARAKEDNSRDRETARDRIDLLERALEDARSAIARTENELEAARSSEERLGRQLEAAQRAATEAESRATTTQMSHAALEHRVRRLHEEIAEAFARLAEGTAPLPAPRPKSEQPNSEQPKSAPPKSAPPDAVIVAPPLLITVESLPPDALVSLAPDSAPVSASPASKSVPPPAPASEAPSPVALIASAPPPTYASVPPRAHESLADASPASHDSIPPSDGWSEPPPPTRRPSSALPPAFDELPAPAPTREELIAKLADPEQAHAAAVALQQHPDWLRSVPPPGLIAALATVDYNADNAIFELARAWDREPLCHSLVASLRSSSEPRLREHSAWLLKHLAAPSSWKAIADLARSENEPAQLRRWLLEALDRLAAGRAVGWRELGDVIAAVSKHADPSLRDGVVGILVSLERSEEKRRLLLEILREDDDEVVLASAVNALAGVLPMELDPMLVERLLGNPSPRVQRSVRDLIERAKRA